MLMVGDLNVVIGLLVFCVMLLVLCVIGLATMASLYMRFICRETPLPDDDGCMAPEYRRSLTDAEINNSRKVVNDKQAKEENPWEAARIDNEETPSVMPTIDR